LAQQCADAMYERDLASRNLNMRILEVAPGMAKLEMKITETMIQGHAACHGGYIFTLADSTFAFACNTYDKTTVASGCNIDYVAPGKLGDVLTATGHEVTRKGRTGVYDIRVENQRGELVVLFRGRYYQIRGSGIECGD